MKTNAVRLRPFFLLALVVLMFIATNLQAQTNTTITNYLYITATQPNAAEGGSNGTFTITKYGGSYTNDITVRYAISGTASNGVDYVTLPGFVTIPRTSTNATITVQPIDDSLAEPTETVILTLLPANDGSVYSFGSQPSATVYIADNDAPTPVVQLLQPTNGASFAYPANVLLQAQATDSLGVSRVYFLNGTNVITSLTNATTGGIYSAIWTNPAPGTYPLSAKALGTYDKQSTSTPVTITITGTLPPPVVTITAYRAQCVESPTTSSTNTGVFLVSRNGQTNNSLTVFYGISGTASNGVDYTTLPGSATIPAGSLSTSVLVVPIDDNLVEGTETVVLSLTDSPIAGPGIVYTIGSPSSATVSILDNDTNPPPPNIPPTVHITSPTNGAAFTAPTNIHLYATAADLDGHVVTVQYFVGNTGLGIVTNTQTSSTTNLSSLYWSNVVAGSYTLTAVATDNSGAQTTSEPINISVITPPPPPTNVPPTVRITNPTNNSTFISPATVRFYALANDSDGHVVSVEFFAGDTSLGVTTNAYPVTGTTSNYFALTWSNAPVGSYALTALATDNAGAQTRSEAIHISVVSPPPPPTPVVTVVAIDAEAAEPSANSTVVNNGVFAVYRDTGTNSPLTVFYSLSGTASNGVDYTYLPGAVTISAGSLAASVVVQPIHDNLVEGTETVVLNLQPSPILDPPAPGAPVSYTIGSPSEAVVNILDNDTNAPPPTNIPPTVHIVSPVNGASYVTPTNVLIYATAHDTDGRVVSVEFFADTTDLGTGYTPSTTNTSGSDAYYRLVWTNPPVGSHVLTAVATDNAGVGTKSDGVTINVTNAPPPVTNIPPSVTITSPTNGSIFTGPITLSISADASDPDDAVAYVSFYAGDHVIGYATNAPFSVTWSNAAAGTYSLTARATDSRGASTVSAPVAIMIRAVTTQAFVSRTLPLWYVPGVKLVAGLAASPSTNVAVWSASDLPPAGWTVGAISDGGSVDANGQVTFGPFTGHDARKMTYEVTPPLTETGSKTFTGTATANDSPPSTILGANTINQAPPHPADNNPTDWFLSFDELAAYSNAWKRCTVITPAPYPVPISYLTRAGFLMESGGGYTVSSQYPTPYPPLQWIPNNATPPTANADALGGVPFVTNTATSVAVSTMPSTYAPGVTFTVTITVTPPSNTMAYAVQDRPPEGFAVTNVSDDGVFCPVTHLVKWGVYLDNAPRTLTYQVTPKTTSTTGTVTFAGVASFDGYNVPIYGQRVIGLGASTQIDPPPSSPLTPGDRVVNLTGQAGVTYTIEASPDLIDWVPVGTLLNNDGVLNYHDPDGTNYGFRFYRIVPQ